MAERLAKEEAERMAKEEGERAREETMRRVREEAERRAPRESREESRSAMRSKRSERSKLKKKIVIIIYADWTEVQMLEARKVHRGKWSLMSAQKRMRQTKDRSKAMC